MRKLIRRIQYWLERRRIDAELAEELETHRSLAQHTLEGRGMSSHDAARASRRALGNTLLAREEARDVWIWPAFERVWQDVRYGARSLAANPNFSLVAVVTLALGIAASTAVFSVVESELLRPLPFPEADRLVAVYGTADKRPADGEPVSIPDFLDWRSASPAFENLAAFRSGNSNFILSSHGAPERLTGISVTANFLSTLRLTPGLGRLFQADDETGGNSHVAILSDGCWRRLFGADPAILGSTIALDGEPYAVVGVASPTWNFEFLGGTYDVFLPTALNASSAPDRSTRDLYAIARLKGDVSVRTAQRDIESVAGRLAAQYPADDRGRSARVEDLRSAYTGYNWRTLLFFLGAALVLLTVSCVNVGNLLLARALGRQREFAIRAALGGGRVALVRQLLVEGAVLALPSGVLGIVLAAATNRAIVSFLPAGYLTRGAEIGLDARVVAFAVAVAGLTSLFFGLAPALFAWRVDLNATLSQGSRGVTGAGSQRRTRRALVVAELSLALVLLFGAGLFTNSFLRLTHMSLGFDPRDRITMKLLVKGPHYAGPAELVDFAQRLVTRVGAEPGVLDAVIANATPLVGAQSAPFVVSGRARPAPGEEPTALVRSVTPRYLTTMGIRLLAGRDFTDADTNGSPRIALVNERLALRMFPGENPIGKTLVVPTAVPTLAAGSLQIVGVLENTKDVGLNEVAFNDIYVPFAQNPPSATYSSSIYLIARTAPDAGDLGPAIRSDVLGLDKDLPILEVATMAQRMDHALRGDRFNMILIAAFAAIAVLLASAGIYGAISYATQQRTREFGVRMALGAPRAQILGLAVTDAAVLTIAGLGVGLVLVLGLGRLLGTSLYLVQGQHEGMLYGVTIFDPLTLACACGVLLGSALLAGYVPARRASRVDPLIALRDG